MNLQQIAQQVQFLLQEQTWPDTVVPVFAPESVLVLAGESDIDALDANLVLPMAVIVPGPGQSDPQANDEPGYWVSTLEVILAVRNSNDRTGQAGVVGANRVGIGDSRGRGVLEIEPQLLRTIELLNVHEGVTIALKSSSGMTTRTDSSDKTYALKSYTFEVSCTSELYYPAVRHLVITETSGEAALTWDNPPDRFDLYRIVVRRAAGATPPASITAGTDVALATPLAEAASDVVAPGTYSYSVFAVYDDFGRGTNNVALPASDIRSSDAVSESGVVIP